MNIELSDFMKYSCPVCKKGFRDLHEKKRHLREEHPKKS